MSKYGVTSEQLTSIADAIRQNTGESGEITFPDGFVEQISGMTPRLIVSEGSGSYTYTSARTISPGTYIQLSNKPELYPFSDVGPIKTASFDKEFTYKQYLTVFSMFDEINNTFIVRIANLSNYYNITIPKNTTLTVTYDVFSAGF